jgi:hypothetical protein
VILLSGLGATVMPSTIATVGQPVLLRFIMPDQALLYDEHVLLVRELEPLEPYNDKGNYWTCRAYIVRGFDPDCQRLYVAPITWFEPLAPEVSRRCCCDACYDAREISRKQAT